MGAPGPRERLHQDPGDPGGPAGDRGHDRGRDQRQRHADLLARAPSRGRRVLHPRARAPRRQRRRPREGRLRGVVLRLARRHRGRQAPRRGGPPGAQGQARDRQRQARVRAVQRGLLRREVGRAGGQGRHQAALPVGVDLDQEPRVPRRHLRRGAGRPRDREHDAARHRRGRTGPRRDRGQAHPGHRGGAQAARGPRGGRRRLRRRRRHPREGGREEVRGLLQGAVLATSSPSATSWWPPDGRQGKRLPPRARPAAPGRLDPHLGRRRARATRPRRCRPPT